MRIFGCPSLTPGTWTDMEERACATRFSAWLVGFTSSRFNKNLRNTTIYSKSWAPQTLDTPTALQLTPSTKTITTPSCTAMIATCRHALPRPLNKFETCPWHAKRKDLKYDVATMTLRSLRMDGKTQGCQGESSKRIKTMAKTIPIRPIHWIWWLMWLQYPLLQWFTATRSIPEVVSPHSPNAPRSSSTTLARRSSASAVLQRWVGVEKTLTKPLKMGAVYQWKTIYIKSWLKIDMIYNCFFNHL